MNSKAQTMGGLLLAFVGIIVGIALFLYVSQTIGTYTNLETYNTSGGNAAVTLAANGASVDLTGQEYGDDLLMYNATGGGLISDGNYTVGEYVSPTTGVKSVYIQTDDAEVAGWSVNVSYTYGPDGYIDNSGGRSMALLIGIFMALGIAVVALVPALRSGVLNMMRK